jgi:pimeloyl-ACP methyl ester carboxylesterase
MWLYIVIIILALWAGIYLYNLNQLGALQKKAGTYGKFATVNGKRMFYRVKGQGEKSVVVLTGLGAPAAEWFHLQDAWAEFAAILTYDRAGVGWSEKSPLPRTSEQIARELDALLQQSGLKAPYLFVAHSQGGLYARHYAYLFPEKVSGVVFLDPLSPRDNEFRKQLPADVFQGSGVDKSASAKMLLPFSKLGLLRLFKSLLIKSPPFYYYKDVPAEYVELVWQHLLVPTLPETYLDENTQAHQDQNNRDLLTIEGFPSVPVRVLYHTPRVIIDEIVQYGGLVPEKAQMVEKLWESLIREYLSLGSESKWMVAENSGHFIHMGAPELVTGIVRELVLSGE